MKIKGSLWPRVIYSFCGAVYKSLLEQQTCGTTLIFVHEKNWAYHPALVDLTAGREAGSQMGPIKFSLDAVST